MSAVSKINRFIKDEDYRFGVMASRGMLNRMPDQDYIIKMYKNKFGVIPNLDNPKTFNEKIQWIKLYDRKPEYTKLVDKYEAKIIVENILGSEYIIPNVGGVYQKFAEIDFETLPEQFVLKCTHDSGGLSICRDKSSFNINEAKAKLEKSINNNFYWRYREWAYKNIPPRIIVEKYMEEPSGRSLVDYKFFCFNGEPKLLYVSEGLEYHPTAKISFFDLDGNLLPFHRRDYAPFKENIILPQSYDKLIETARKLARAIPSLFARIDLYDIDNKVYFGEITLYPNAGLIPFEPMTADEELGRLLKLPFEE